MNRLDTASRTQIITALCEGNSIRSVCRMFNVSKGTVTRLLFQVGLFCSQYQDENLRNLACARVQVDEIWSFCYSKEKNVPQEKHGEFGYGSVWTWCAIDADTKLIASWVVGNRELATATMFMKDLASRLSTRIQLTSDGLRAYIDAVEAAFGSNIDYAQQIKQYGEDQMEHTRYSPGKVIGSKIEVIKGNPDPKHISTSYVERQNLTMRMGMRRFTRLTNAFSKKIENHMAAIALHFMYYNFVKVHGSLRVTPAMAAGVTERVWDVLDIVLLMEAQEGARTEKAKQDRLDAACSLSMPSNPINRR
jgi:IS1 family transposase